ncbi:hypothetical protein BJ912DRAFT_1090904 [Pholiota molesta]|nr:hypothetical protein BJ912DRAFT_1090904 [Pholiota molesta]
MSAPRKSIRPNPPRWTPNPDPASIAPTTDQIEQIEQLITIKLQPVREAAKVFLDIIYEQAAQIRIPTFDDYSTVNENTSEREDTEASSEDQHDKLHRIRQSTSTVNSETSFLPGQGAFSSTPAISRMGKSNSKTHREELSEQPSWTTSLESPLVRLNREINEFSNQTADDNQDASIDSTFRQDDTSILPASEKGKGKDASHPLLRNVLRHNLYSASDNSTFDGKTVSPLKFRSKPKTPTINKSLNPYLSSASPAEWSGVVDLHDDSFDGLPPGMSPPVLMSSAVLERIKLGQTPARDASARIQRDLLRDAQFKSGGNKNAGAYAGSYYDSSMSTVPTPPSLSRYRRDNDYSSSSNVTKDSSLESMIQRIRDDIRPNVGATPGMATPGLRIRPRIPASPILGGQDSLPIFQRQQQQSYSPEPSEPATPVYNQMLGHQDDLDSSDSLDLDEINNTAHPSAAFLMASQGVHGQYDDDNSFGSSNNSSDSLADEDVVGTTGIVPIHPFAQSGPVVEDDGFDDEDESFDGFETQRMPIGGGGGANGSSWATGELRMLGDELLQDTIGIGSHIASSGRMVDESPTPASWVPR